MFTTMDVRLVLLLAVCAVVLVDASSSSRYRPSGRCDVLCRRGVQSPFCRCRRRSPCDLKRCSSLARCVVRYGRGVCVPRSPYSYTPIACRAPKVVGRCRAVFPRYFYNSSTRRCEHFIYGGCGANSNNFLSLRECTAKCRRGARRSRDRD